MKLIAIDLELNQPSGKIIQIGAALGDLSTGEILGDFSGYVRIDEPLSERIIKLTGITEKDLESAPLLSDVYSDLVKWKYSFVMNDIFRNPVTWGGGDTHHLRKNLGLTDDWEFGFRHIDAKTVYMAWRMATEQSLKSGLAKSLTRLGLNFKGRKHNAKDDAVNTFIIYYELLKQFKKE